MLYIDGDMAYGSMVIYVWSMAWYNYGNMWCLRFPHSGNIRDNSGIYWDIFIGIVMITISMMGI